MRLLWSLFALALADYYDTLGLKRGANTKDIKKAYRQLSRQYHPDKNNGNEEAAKKFIEIGTAYEVLVDDEQRAIYDKFGEAGLKNGGQQHSDPFDLFSRFFGGARQQGRPHGQNAMARLQVSLQQSYLGSTIEFDVNMQGLCYECNGSGSADGQMLQCDQCKGAGQIVRNHQLGFGMMQRIQMPCDQCGGKGQKIKNACGVCHGSKVIREDRHYNVYLPEGAPRQWDYVLEGEGDQGPDFDPGNLIIRLTESPNDNFGYRRRGQNLFRTEAISAKQALSGGWERQIMRLDGETSIKISRKKGQAVVNGEVQLIKEEGMPSNKDHEAGDLYIEYVVLPVSAKGGAHLDL